MRPRLLDLFCGAGGAARGYQQAGFYVVGVDVKPQPRYVGDEFIHRDALDILDYVTRYPRFWNFDAIHASPPCQAYSFATVQNRAAGKKYPDLLAETRALLEGIGLPWVIENVPGSPMRPDFKLCGCMFDLPRLRRERWFETSWHGFDLRSPCIHIGPTLSPIGHNTPGSSRFFKAMGRTATKAELDAAMGIDWMNRDERALAIPPAYTRYIGAQLLAALDREVSA